MSGYVDEFAGPPSDDGVASEAWKMSWQIDGAREAFVESKAPFGVDTVTPLVEALTSALEVAGAVPVPQAPEPPVRAPGLGWSAKRGRA